MSLYGWLCWAFVVFYFGIWAGVAWNRRRLRERYRDLRERYAISGDGHGEALDLDELERDLFAPVLGREYSRRQLIAVTLLPSLMLLAAVGAIIAVMVLVTV